MSITVQILQGPLPPQRDTPSNLDGAGAVILFEGVVRAQEGDGTIEALWYEAYRPMADQALERLGALMVQEHGLIALAVEHSVGRVGVGECSFRLRIASRHRKEGLAAMDRFIDLMKRDVPIWKAVAPATVVD